jgi:hypothetical protein
MAKLSAAGSLLAYSTYLGGTAMDYGGGIAASGSMRAYVTGLTSSANFPTTPGAFDATHNGGSDVFVSALDLSVRLFLPIALSDSP